MPRVRRHAPARHRRGNATFTALSIIALLGFGALTVDIGHARMTRAQLQNAADAAAHAAILDIDGTAAGLEAARSAALYVASLNRADRDPVVLAYDDVVFGIYVASANTFSASEDPLVVNAVIVNHQKLDIGAIFGLVAFGVDKLGAGVSSMAVLPPPSPATKVICYLPIAVPACQVTTPGIFDFQASNSGTDSAGWAAIPGEDGEKPNADFLKQQLSGTDCQGADVGDTANVMNGVVSSALALALDRIDRGADHFDGTDVGPWTKGGYTIQPPDAWPTDLWDQPAASDRMKKSAISQGSFGASGLGGPVMMVTQDADGDGQDDFCQDDDGDGEPDNPPNWNGELELVGFVYGMIYDGKTGGNGVARIRVNTEVEFDDYATEGGGDAPVGLVYQDPPRIVPPP